MDVFVIEYVRNQIVLRRLHPITACKLERSWTFAFTQMNVSGSIFRKNAHFHIVRRSKHHSMAIWKRTYPWATYPYSLQHYTSRSHEKHVAHILKEVLCVITEIKRLDNFAEEQTLEKKGTRYLQAVHPSMSLSVISEMAVLSEAKPAVCPSHQSPSYIAKFPRGPLNVTRVPHQNLLFILHRPAVW